MAGKHTTEGNTGSQGRATQVPGGAMGKRPKKGQQDAQSRRGGSRTEEDREQKTDQLEASDLEDELEDEQLDEDLDEEEADLEEENERPQRRH